MASSGSADQVSTISSTDLADSGRLASFERIDISLSIRETGMKPSPSRQPFAPEFDHTEAVKVRLEEGLVSFSVFSY